MMEIPVGTISSLLAIATCENDEPSTKLTSEVAYSISNINDLRNVCCQLKTEAQDALKDCKKDDGFNPV